MTIVWKLALWPEKEKNTVKCLYIPYVRRHPAPRNPVTILREGTQSVGHASHDGAEKRAGAGNVETGASSATHFAGTKAAFPCLAPGRQYHGAGFTVIIAALRIMIDVALSVAVQFPRRRQGKGGVFSRLFGMGGATNHDKRQT